MKNNEAFKKIPFYAAVGVSLFGEKERCGVIVESGEPTKRILKPNYNLKHLFTHFFTFNSCRKVPFSAIIGNLVANGIFPCDDDGFNPPENPDNKFYLELPVDRKDDIIKIIRLTLDGITLGPDFTPSYNEFVLSEDDIAEEKRMDESNRFRPGEMPLIGDLRSKTIVPLARIGQNSQEVEQIA